MNEKKRCLICDKDAHLLMNDLILNKYSVDYYVCPDCKCIFTETPFWLEEAYTNSIASTDTGIMMRNISICNELMLIFNGCFHPKIKVVDYGGGYGILTRMLRDRGVDAYWYDKYSKNLLSKGFEYKGTDKVDVIVAFEVIEHLPNPLEVIKEIMSKTECFIFSTLLLTQFDYKTNKEWWYFSPESGQHIFFSSKETMNIIAEKLGCYYSYINGLHILHNSKLFFRKKKSIRIKSFIVKVFNELCKYFIQGRRFKSKTWDDHLLLKQNIEINTE